MYVGGSKYFMVDIGTGKVVFEAGRAALANRPTRFCFVRDTKT
jgi:hypothetical protein